MDLLNPKMLLLISICCILFSLIYYYQGKINFAVKTLVLAGLFLRLFVSMDAGLHPWDERYHALVAKNLLLNPFEPKLYPVPLLEYDYKGWISNYIWLHKPPFGLWLISLSLNCFGISELAVRLPSVFLTTISIYFVFYIGLFIKDKNVAYLVAFLFAINGFIIELAGGRMPTDHIDSIFTSLFLLCIFLSIKLINFDNLIYSLFIGTSLSAAILTKWIIALFAIPLICILLLHFDLPRKSIIKRLVYIMAIAVIFVLPWFIYTYSHFPNEAKWESEFNFMHIFQTLEGHSGSLLFYINKIRINYHELIYIPLIWFVYKLILKPREYKNQFLFLWFFLPLLFFSVCKTKMDGYLEFTAAAYMIIIAIFLFDLKNKLYVGRFRWFKIVVFAIFILFPVRYSVEKIKPLQTQNELPWIKELRELDKIYKGKYVILNFKYEIEAMFYSDFIVYNDCPTQSMIDKMIQSGYRVLINKKGVCDVTGLNNASFINLNE